MAAAAPEKKRPVWVAGLALAAAVAGWWFFPDGQETETPQGVPAVSSSAAPGEPSESAAPDASAPSPSTTARPSRVPSPALSQAPGGFDWIDAEEIPDPGDEVLDAIDAGGPFEYPPHDGSVFGNREGLLPAKERGYYREYTVETPGLNHRGARRIVVGRGGEFYWTDDHYASFERIQR